MHYNMWHLFITFLFIKYYLYICNMILIIEHDNGEQWEDYHKWVQYVLDIKTDKSTEELYNDYKSWFVDLMKQNQNIDVNPNWINTLIETNIIEYKKKKKILDKSLKYHTFHRYLHEMYDVNDLPINIIHDYITYKKL